MVYVLVYQNGEWRAINTLETKCREAPGRALEVDLSPSR